MSSRYDEPSQSPGFMLWHTTLRWQRLMTATLKEHGLTHVQFVLLASAWWLTEHGALPTQRQVADHAGTDAMMTSQVLRTLERMRYVTRATDPRDARGKRIRLTELGAQALRDALPAVEEADLQFFNPVSDPICFVRGLGELRGHGTERSAATD
ncbi:MAG: MarR family winged helix-turn-helix transcriptional regulator [Chloroflexota bacterium]